MASSTQLIPARLSLKPWTLSALNGFDSAACFCACRFRSSRASRTLTSASAPSGRAATSQVDLVRTGLAGCPPPERSSVTTRPLRSRGVTKLMTNSLYNHRLRCKFFARLQTTSNTRFAYASFSRLGRRAGAAINGWWRAPWGVGEAVKSLLGRRIDRAHSAQAAAPYPQTSTRSKQPEVDRSCRPLLACVHTLAANAPA